MSRQPVTRIYECRGCTQKFMTSSGVSSCPTCKSTHIFVVGIPLNEFEEIIKAISK